ncbi:MAG: hypothetical protein OK441_02835, partial [Thaumarchaeota archaeon]|nr:hypothetical protein [Nitrososphaerota archaeon]
MGVASSGSRLFWTFSPTMLYEAIPVGRLAAPITNQKENAFRNGATDADMVPVPATLSITTSIPGNPKAM